MIRLFASDLDGTLLNETSQLEQETIEAIKTFQKQGGIFMVATGRNRWEVSQLTDHISGMIFNCVNGSLLCDDQGKEIVAFDLDQKAAERFERMRIECGCTVLYHAEKERFCNLSREQMKRLTVDYLVRENAYSPKRAEDFFEYMLGDGRTIYSASLEDVLPSRILKMEILFVDTEDYPKRIEMAHSRFQDYNVVNGSFFNNIEITSPDSGKEKLIKEYCRITGIKEDETAVIGDSGNDVGMLRSFKNSYAMGNAPKEVKEVATFVAEGNDSLGAAKVLREICRRNREEADA